MTQKSEPSFDELKGNTHPLSGSPKQTISLGEESKHEPSSSKINGVTKKEQERQLNFQLSGFTSGTGSNFRRKSTYNPGTQSYQSHRGITKHPQELTLGDLQVYLNQQDAGNPGVGDIEGLMVGEGGFEEGRNSQQHLEGRLINENQIEANPQIDSQRQDLQRDMMAVSPELEDPGNRYKQKDDPESIQLGANQ